MNERNGVALGFVMTHLLDAKNKTIDVARDVEIRDLHALNEAQKLIDQAMDLIRPVWFNQFAPSGNTFEDAARDYRRRHGGK